MSKLIRFILPAVTLLCAGSILTGCAPRGETHTVAEVLNDARAAYNDQAKNRSTEPLKSTMNDLASALEAMVSGDGAAAPTTSNALKAADIMTGLVKTAGYPSRPAMGEIIMQQRVLSLDAAKNDVSAARVDLLVARTYALLASELEGTQFSVQPLSRP